MFSTRPFIEDVVGRNRVERAVILSLISNKVFVQENKCLLRTPKDKEVEFVVLEFQAK